MSIWVHRVDGTVGISWTLDSTSNWKGFREAASGGSWTTVQSRNANSVNEITGITNSIGSSWATPAYDAAGSTTTIPKPADPGNTYTGTYDAWNRMMVLTDTSSGLVVQKNQYDARKFRVARLDYTAGSVSETRHFYYSPQWQSLEERLGTSPSTADPERQQVWGVRYSDDLALRDRDTDGNGALNERMFGVLDANWNVVALIDTSGAAQERYLYSAFGSPTTLDGSMSTILPASLISSEILFTAQHFDLSTSLHLFRMRFLDHTGGRFLSRDPLGYPDGPSGYGAFFIINDTDPYGLALRRCKCSSQGESSTRTVFTGATCYDYCCAAPKPCCSGFDLTTPDLSKLESCCGNDPKCQDCLSTLIDSVFNTPVPNYGGNKCFRWLDSFLEGHPSYQPFGPIGTAGKVSLCDGKIVLEPQKIPVRNKKGGNYITTERNYWFGYTTAWFTDHGVVKVTIGSCTAYFDIGSGSNQGNFGGDDHWWFPSDGSDDANDFQSFMDHSKTECYVPTGSDTGQ